MVEPTKDRMRDNVSEPFDLSRVRRVLPKRNVSSYLVIIGGVFRENSPKVLGVEYDQMIKTFASDRPDQAVLSENHIRTYWWCSPDKIGIATMTGSRDPDSNKTPA
jgi:hypothetical protein